MSEGAWPFPSADTSPRGRAWTHPDRVSVLRNEVTPSGPGVASRDAARRIDTQAGTGSPKKRWLPAARRRATGQRGLMARPERVLTWGRLLRAERGEGRQAAGAS